MRYTILKWGGGPAVFFIFQHAFMLFFTTPSLIILNYRNFFYIFAL